MAFQALEYTKSWKNAGDFPTYEPDEAQVRADLQLLHDEARDGLNRLVEALNDPSAAEQLPFRGQGLAAGNVRDAILETYGAIRQAAAGLLVNGSVTAEKLSPQLLERVYGGRLWVSMDAPGRDQNPDSGFPVGQLWLRPAFTVDNLAGAAWSATACTVQAVAGGWQVTGSGTQAVVRISQTLPNLGTAGQRVYVALQAEETDSQLTALTLRLGGAAHNLLGGRVFEAALDAGGGLTAEVTAQWPAAALASGSFRLTGWTVVNAGRAEDSLTDCKPLTDWPGLLERLIPFESARLGRMVFVQTAPGQWAEIEREVLPVGRGGTGLAQVEAGQLLYGGAETMEVLPPPESDGSVLRFLDGRPVWSAVGETVAALGSLRLQTGTYTGTASARTVTLPVEPALLLIFPQDGPYAKIGEFPVYDNPVVLGNGAKSMESHWGAVGSNGQRAYQCAVALSGNVLTCSMQAYGDISNASDTYCNRSGVTYRWVAVY